MFSDRENKIIKIISDKKLSITTIADKLFKDDETAPFEPNIAISNSIRRIAKKCTHFKLNWTLDKEKCKRETYIYKIKNNDKNI